MSQSLSSLDKIAMIVDRYNAIPKDRADIETLTVYQQKLSCILFEYAGEVGDLYKLAIGTEATRKIAYERKRLELIADGKSASAADIEARASVDSLQVQETAADGDYKAAMLQLNASRDVLEAIRQHISTLKQEQRLEMTGQGSQHM